MAGLSFGGAMDARLGLARDKHSREWYDSNTARFAQESGSLIGLKNADTNAKNANTMASRGTQNIATSASAKPPTFSNIGTVTGTSSASINGDIASPVSTAPASLPINEGMPGSGTTGRTLYSEDAAGNVTVPTREGYQTDVDPSAPIVNDDGLGANSGVQDEITALRGTSRVTDTTGNGSPTVDTIPAKLADGEAVLNAGAAETMGRKEIAKRNRDGLIRMGLSPNNKPKFKDGAVHAFGGIDFNDPAMKDKAASMEMQRRIAATANQPVVRAPVSVPTSAPVTPTVAPAANAGTAELKILADQVKNGESTSPNYKHSPLDARTGPTVTKAGTIPAGQGVPRSLSLTVPNPTNVVPAGAASVPTVPPGTSVVPSGPLNTATPNAAPSAKGAAFTSEELNANRARAAAGQAAQDAARSQHRVINIPKASPSLASRGWGLMKTGFKAATGPIGLGITAALHSKDLANDDAMFAPDGRFRKDLDSAKGKEMSAGEAKYIARQDGNAEQQDSSPAVQAPIDPDEAGYSAFFNSRGITDEMRRNAATPKWDDKPIGQDKPGIWNMRDVANIQDGSSQIYKVVDKDGKVSYIGTGSNSRAAAEKAEAKKPKTKEAVEIAAAQAALEENAYMRGIRDKAIEGDPDAISAWNMINQKSAPKDEWEHVIQKSTDEQGNVTETPMLYNKRNGKFAQNNAASDDPVKQAYADAEMAITSGRITKTEANKRLVAAGIKPIP